MAIAREPGRPNEGVLALVVLNSAAAATGDVGEAVRLARQADQVLGDIVPSAARSCRMALTDRLIEIGDFAAAEPVCAAALAVCQVVGHTNAQIAARLHIGIRTVSSHLDRIRDKTGARRRADLTRLALTAGLI